MILALVYFLLFIWLLKKNSFFLDAVVSYKWLWFIVCVKLLSALVYHWIYYDYYTGEFLNDSESTLRGAKVIYGALKNNIVDYLKIIFGWHSESTSDPLYELYFKHIDKWDRADVTSDFFLNDNRTPTRINAVIMLFSFGNYYVHAVFMLVLSFLGQWYLYKTFKSYFPSKELLLLFILTLTPSVLFWTSGVLKEPIAFFLLGMFVYCFFQLFRHKQFKFIYWVGLSVSVYLFLILKPYILGILFIPAMAYIIAYHKNIKRSAAYYVGFIVFFILMGFVILKIAFQKDVLQTIVVRQNDFINLSKGGTFFYNNEKYVRLDYANDKLYDVIGQEGDKKLCKIKPNISLMYWNFPNLNDTVFVERNQDTSVYWFISSCAPSGSAINMERLEYSFLSFARVIPKSFLNVLVKPFFYDARGVLDLVTSFENLLFMIFFVFCIRYRAKQPVDHNFLWFCICVVILGFLLVGLTTTVLGAIVRYKIPFLPFMLMIPLLYLNPDKIKRFPILKRFISG